MRRLKDASEMYPCRLGRWSAHISMNTNLTRENGILVKLRCRTSNKLLTTVYNVLFESHMRYGYQFWG